MPNSVDRCSTNMSNSSKLPLSSRSSIRSRAVSLPRACCAAMRFSPPPSLAPARRASRVSRMSFMSSFPARFSPFVLTGLLTLGNAPRGRPAVPRPISSAFRQRPVHLISGVSNRGKDDDGKQKPGDDREATGAVSGGVRTLLRLEGLTLLAGMTLLYGLWGGPWWLYAVLFLAPDLSFLGYLAGPRWAPIAYNAVHSYIVPLATDNGRVRLRPAAAAFRRDDLARAYRLRPRARLWAEISGGFGFTHLGRIGRGADVSKV